ncbi:MAG: DUF4440 domain-containing protein [Chthoniobacterales bacterium]
MIIERAVTLAVWSSVISVDLSSCLLASALAVEIGGTNLLAQAQDAEAAVRTIVEREAQFYQLAQEAGTRAAFLEFLAEDALVFQPGPVNGRKAWSARPDGGLWLKWQPVFAAMSRGADLGYTTGPAEWRRQKEDEKPFGYGQFISIWKKQKDGVWKVVLDVGNEVPGPEKIKPPELSVSSGAAPGKRSASAGARKLREAEASFAESAKSDSTAGLIGSSSEGVRVHREGVFPAVGRDAAGVMLSVKRGKLALKWLGGEMSSAGDLAYSYGRYSLDRAEKTERGHYLQIWRRDDAGEWKLALDYQAPLAAEEKKRE